MLKLPRSSLVKKHASCLSLAADEVGSPQVRNAGTIGGNVINAQPAADTALALTALDAEAELVTEKGTTWAKIPSLYERPGISTVDSTSQVISRFRLKLPDEFSGSAYRRLGKCKSIALPVLCSATVLRVQDGLITHASLALGPVAMAPFRALETENFLAGKKPVMEVFSQAAEVARSESKPHDSLLRCSKLYRENLVNVLVESTLQQALGNIQERNR